MTLLVALLLAAPDPARALAQRVQHFYAHSRDLQVKKPGFVRWDYQKPDKRVLYVENRTLWIWRPDDNEVQVKRDFGGDQLSSAFTFLWGKGDLLKEFAPKKVDPPKGLPAGDGLELTPLKPTPGVSSLLFVVGKDGQVLASVVTNPQGDVNQMTFSAAKVNQGLEDKVFHFEPPKGAYVQEF